MRKKTDPIHWPAICPTTGKRAWPTRKAARRHARRIDHHGLNAYRCGDHWHLGHLPTGIRRGIYTRDDLNRQDDTA